MVVASPILITGAARSGTSLVAGSIFRCGAWGGELAGSTSSNKRGMYENTYIRNHIIKPFLKSLGLDPMGQRDLPDTSMFLPVSSELALIWRNKILTVIKDQEYKKGPWFYKGAKMCLFWPVWHAAFPNAKWIIVRRDPDSIVASCLKAPFMRTYKTPSGWLGWVAKHEEKFEEMLNARLNIYEVWPQRMINGDYAQMQIAVNGVGLGWKFDEVQKFVEPSLWHKPKGESK